MDIEWTHDSERYTFSAKVEELLIFVASDLAGGTSWGYLIWSGDTVVAGEKNWHWNAYDAKEKAEGAIVVALAKARILKGREEGTAQGDD